MDFISILFYIVKTNPFINIFSIKNSLQLAGGYFINPIFSLISFKYLVTGGTTCFFLERTPGA